MDEAHIDEKSSSIQPEIVQEIIENQKTRVKVTVLEQSANCEIELCSKCSNFVNKLQHPDASYAIKFDEYFVEGKEEQDHQTSFPANDGEEGEGLDMFEVLEKRLLFIESRLQSTNKLYKPAEFKRLCENAISCEDEWSNFYCQQNSLDVAVERENVLNLLRENLDKRRVEAKAYPPRFYGERPPPFGRKFMPSDFPKRPVNASNTYDLEKISINTKEEKCFGICKSITNITEGPHQVYLDVLDNPCVQLENRLFEIELKLRKMVEDGLVTDPEYYSLVKEAQQIREEWKMEFNIRKHPNNFYPKGFDKNKCLVRSGRRPRRPDSDGLY